MRPLLVGIAGGTASGKTTLARYVQAALGDRCVSITHDRYYRPIPPDAHGEPRSWNFDHPDSLDNERLVHDLELLADGRVAHVPRYDFALHARADETDPVAPTEVVLVDGILLFAHAGLRERFDLRVFVDAPADVRLARRMLRDICERGRSPASVVDQYLHTVRPMHEVYVQPSSSHAHMVVDGLLPIEQTAPAVLERLGR